MRGSFRGWLTVGTAKHGIQQQLGPRQRALGLDVLVGVVAYAVAAWRENHGRRRQVRNRVGVVASLAQHLPERQAQSRRRLFQQGDAFGRKQGGAPAPTLRHRHADAGLGLRCGNGRLDLAVHALEASRFGMPKVDDQPHLFGNDARQIGKAFDPRRCGAPFLAGKGQPDIINGGDQIAGTDQGIAPLTHWRAAGVAGLAVNIDAQAQRLVATDHDADIAAFPVELRRLLDVQLQVTVEPALAQWRLTEITDARQFVAETKPGIVRAVVDLGTAKLARKGQRTHQRRTETSPFLVAPHDQLDRPNRVNAVIVQTANSFQTAQHAESTVVLAAADLRVEMAADGDGGEARIGPRPTGEQVTDGIDLHRAAGLARPGDDEVAHLLVLLRQRQAAHTAAAKAADFAAALQSRPQSLAVDLEHADLLHARSPPSGSVAALRSRKFGPANSISRPATRKQRVVCPAACTNCGGWAARHRSSANRQRGEKLHPAGNARKSGGIPAIASSRLPNAEPSTVEVSRAAV